MKYTFIIGCARSGTSILGELIASHPQVKYVFEASQIWELGGMGENESHRLTAQAATPQVKAQIRAWFESQASGANIVVEKNPRNSLRVPYVKEIFPEAKFIHIVRDGRDVACSLVPGCGGREWRHLKPPSWQEYYTTYSGAIRCAHVWKEVLEIALHDLLEVRHIQVRYEDLLNSPLSVARSIFDFLEIDFHRNTVDFCSKIADDTSAPYHAQNQDRWYQNNHQKRIGRWQENLTSEEQHSINEMLNPLLTKLGYKSELKTNISSAAFSVSEQPVESLDIGDKRLVVVLGMHRSGTSAVTRGLEVLGVELGNKFLPAQTDNVKGFWEDSDLNALNTEMLSSLNRDWHFLTPIEKTDVDILCQNGYRQRAIELLQAKTSTVAIFGFKDPRLAKLLPFWKDVFAHGQFRASYIITIRHPLSVCKSLAVRNGFDFEKSHILWLEHVLSSLVGTVDENCVLVDYDRLMELPEQELERIAEKLQLRLDLSELEKFKTEFLDQELRHTVYQLDDLLLDKTVPPLTREVYEEALNIATDRAQLDDETIRKKLILWNNEFSRQRSALLLLDKLTVKIELMSQAMAEKEQFAQALSNQIRGIYQSRSWRWTEPLRKLFSILPHSK